jgi:nucleotide-binding universal stress UspA family protein
MYKRILVPVDGSDTSKRGLRAALELADDAASVRVVNVVDENLIPASRPVKIGGDREFIASLKARGEQVLKEARAAVARKRVRSDCVQRLSGPRTVSEAILDEAAKWRADVIVMGTHGRRGLRRLLMGSDASHVLREAAVPVLLVRGDNGRAAA